MFRVLFLCHKKLKNLWQKSQDLFVYSGLDDMVQGPMWFPDHSSSILLIHRIGMDALMWKWSDILKGALVSSGLF